LLVDLLPPLIAAKGYSSPETDEAISQALKLTAAAAHPAQLYPLLYAVSAYLCVTGQIIKAGPVHKQLRQLYKLHPTVEVAPLVERMIGARAFMQGNARSGRRLIERALARYDRDKHASSAAIFGQDHLVAGLGYLCLAQWQLGFVELALKHHR